MAILAVLIPIIIAMPAQSQECTPGISIDTVQVQYFQGTQVTVSGTYYDSQCNPVVTNGIGVQVNLPNGMPFKPWQGGTNSEGLFEFSFTLPSNAMTGTWQVISAHGGNYDSEDFLVTEPRECFEGETQQCGETDVGACTFGNETCENGEWTGCDAILPATEVCGDGKDNDCDGSVDEGCTTGGGGGSRRGGVCLPKYNCTEWGPCQSDGTQTRTCTQVAGCGTTTTKPEETQTCTYIAGEAECQEDWSCSTWSECLDDQQSRSCSDRNACGTDENKPVETQACEAGPAEAGAESPITGFFLDPVSMYALVIIVIVALMIAVALKSRKPSSSSLRVPGLVP
jgi:hypothetical protein